MSAKEIEERNAEEAEKTAEKTMEKTSENTAEKTMEKTAEKMTEEATEEVPPTHIRYNPYTGMFTNYSLPENHPYRIFRLDHSSGEESDDEIV